MRTPLTDRQPGLANFVPVGPSPSAGSTRASEQALPIWLAVLLASPCQARSNETRHDVRWDCISGRALYTNFTTDAERIEPLGVDLHGGQTLAVSWHPGETAYTLEVYPQYEERI